MPNIPARITIAGIAHRVEPAKTKGSESTPPQDCARVTVLTDGGGFVEVYYGPDAFHAAPAARADVAIVADMSHYVRYSEAGKPYAFEDIRAVAPSAAFPPAPLAIIPGQQESHSWEPEPVG